MPFTDGICHTVRLFPVVTITSTGPKSNSVSFPNTSPQSSKIKILGSLHCAQVNWLSEKMTRPELPCLWLAEV